MYFEQIIFNQLPKKEVNSLFGMKYWFEHSNNEADFMVRCPVCGKSYCYAHVRSATRWDLLQEIEQNEAFFSEEWAFHCPDYSIHNELINVKREVWG